MEIRTDESFCLKGFWWIPSDDLGHRAHGTLRYEPSAGISLEAVDFFGGPMVGLHAPTVIPVIHGETVQGKLCTLFNVICRNSTATLHGHSEERFESNFLVHGECFSSTEEISVSRIRVGFLGLAEWLTERWPGKNSFPEIAESGSVTIPLDAARLVFREERYKEGGRFSETSGTTFSALFEFDEPISLDDLNEIYVRPLHDLLVLGTNEEIRVTERTILVDEELEKWWDGKPLQQTRSVAVVQRSELNWHAGKAKAFDRVPLPFVALDQSPVAGIQRWYALRAELAGAGNALFATVNRRFRALEGDLLSLLSVAEGYHRARFDSPVVAQEEHSQAVEAMVGALPEHLRTNYSGRLRYANEQTQRQRLKDLFKKAEVALPMAKDWSSLVHGLVLTRNFLTHWGDESEDALTIPEQIKALTKLEIVLRVNLMLDLGLQPTEIQTSVEMSHGSHSALAD